MMAILLLICAIQCEASGGSWTYKDLAHWPNVEPIAKNECGKKTSQSPTDILTTTAVAPTLVPLATVPARNLTAPVVGEWEKKCGKDIKQFLNPHTWEVEFPLEEGGECGKSYENYPHVVWAGKRYNLAQFHYHSPSEHTFDGKYTDMEVHHVHKADDGQALVVAVNVKVGAANPFLAQYWSNFPTGLNNKVKITGTQFTPYQHFFPASTNGGTELSYYHYMGSFTTPPCTTGTVWILLKDTVTMSAEQLTAYRTAISGVPEAQKQVVVLSAAPLGVTEPWDVALGVNNRTIQPANPILVYNAPGGKAAKEAEEAAAEAEADSNTLIGGIVIASLALLFLVGGSVMSKKKKKAKEAPKKKKSVEEEDEDEDAYDELMGGDDGEEPEDNTYNYCEPEDGSRPYYWKAAEGFDVYGDGFYWHYDGDSEADDAWFTQK